VNEPLSVEKSVGIERQLWGVLCRAGHRLPSCGYLVDLG
jgi:hypothetical protein